MAVLALPPPPLLRHSEVDGHARTLEAAAAAIEERRVLLCCRGLWRRTRNDGIAGPGAPCCRARPVRSAHATRGACALGQRGMREGPPASE